MLDHTPLPPMTRYGLPWSAMADHGQLWLVWVGLVGSKRVFKGPPNQTVCRPRWSVEKKDACTSGWPTDQVRNNAWELDHCFGSGWPGDQVRNNDQAMAGHDWPWPDMAKRAKKPTVVFVPGSRKTNPGTVTISRVDEPRKVSNHCFRFPGRQT